MPSFISDACPPFGRTLLLAALLAAQAATAEPDDTQALPAVQVTGSRLLRTQAEGPSAVTVIKGADLSRLGYKNVFDALSSLTQNTGFTQGEDYGNTFTPAANAISLRGLGPNHTLTLINGRRVADYPTAYEGQVNFVNLANVPAALIDRIEVLSGGASAIYGSDAIAGVVNIILKKQADGVELNVKAGGTEKGGGENLRVQLTGGLPGQGGALQGIWSLEWSKRQPIWARQRDFMADTTLQGAAPTGVFTRRDAGTRRYIDPGAGTCEALSPLFDGSTQRYTGGSGSYCASGRAQPSYWTTQTGNDSLNLAGLASREIAPGTELFAEVLLGTTRTQNNTRGPNWTSLAATTGYFHNSLNDTLETWTRRVAPEELGGADRINRSWHDATGNVAVGLRGDFGGALKGWSYEATYNASAYRSKTRTPRLLASVDTFFLGPQQGIDAQGVPIYAADPKRLFRALTPADTASLLGTSEGLNQSWNHGLSFSTRGELATLPASPLQLAAVLEVGSQGFSNEADPRLGQGVFYNTLQADEVKGTRQRSALAAELSAPLARQLTATLAGRYDDYRFAGRHNGKFTYQGGLEFRPLKELLLRATHATSFRAPDMSYIYTAESRGYYSSSTDYYRCAQAGQPLASCEFNNVSPGFNYVSTGSKDLKPENGRSAGLGLVWAPQRDFDVSLDLWKVSISNLVTDLDADKVLRDEADCRTGVQDIASPSCVDALNRVRRNPDNAVVRPGEVNEIHTNPINAARQSTRGLDLGARYAWRTQAAGDFEARLQYTRVQRYVYQQFAGDSADNKVGTRDFGDWPSKLQATLDWRLGAFDTVLAASRFGRLPDSDTGWVKPQWLFNLSGSFELSPASRISVIVNNVAGKVVRDNSGGWPFYPVGYYSPHGRQGWVEFNHRFGS